MGFDINKYKNLTDIHDRYERRIAFLQSTGIDIKHIEKTVKEALDNVESGTKSFVIYGEPQSGKTEMMIALTAKLLDKGHKIIIVLLNDNVQLLNQNLDRYRKSGIDPTPINVPELEQEEEIANKRWIIFSKKNNRELRKLINKLSGRKGKIIIDDEADYASPNAKINKQEQTAINHSIDELLGEEGVYIGVTATPARLDLNNTFDNLTEKWICFEPHKSYVGRDVFFPLHSPDLPDGSKYSLKILPQNGDDPKHLKEALLSFLVNVGHINTDSSFKGKLKNNGQSESNFCFLVHKSGRVDDHDKDKKTVSALFDVLSDEKSTDYEKSVGQLYDIAEKKYGTNADIIVKFILKNIARKTIVIMNCKKKTDTDPTDPPALFTVAIGGNIISRGVTFNNLLGMFFTREAKHRIQQDTYVQRARMFGTRGAYLRFFELWIPVTLYLDWHRCFVYHYLSLEAVKTTNSAPVWISDARIFPVSPSSIDKRTVVNYGGDMYFDKFDYSDELEKILNSSVNELRKLEMINILGGNYFPQYIINFIKSHGRNYAGYIAFHPTRLVKKETAYHDELFRKGKESIFGGTDKSKYPQACHHIIVLRNTYDKARIVYNYTSKVQFIKNIRSHNI